MSLNKILALTSIFLLIVIGAESFYYFKTNKTKTNILPTIIPTTNIEPSPSPKLKILFQAPDDKEGRTVFYDNLSYRFSGIGEFFDYSLSDSLPNYIIGSFVGWEDILGSKDKYLLLENPLTKKLLLKSRVALEPSSLFDDIANDTAIGLENLSTGKKEDIKLIVRKLSQEKINQLIQKGDAVVSLSLRDNEGYIKKDSQGKTLAVWLLIRREKGKEMINID